MLSSAIVISELSNNISMEETLEELLARKEYLETHTPEEAEATFCDVAHVFTDTDSVRCFINTP